MRLSIWGRIKDEEGTGLFSGGLQCGSSGRQGGKEGASALQPLILQQRLDWARITMIESRMALFQASGLVFSSKPIAV